ncbi:MAG: hypothetical protein M3Q30_16275 [Actinomycetota bacterium]|nr:hypothetical protein [Actinomycetota bacterium]
MATCPGSLILHADGTVAGCSEDDEADGFRGRELRHEGDPVVCYVWSVAGCDYCGVTWSVRVPRRPQELKRLGARPPWGVGSPGGYDIAQRAGREASGCSRRVW